MKNLINTIVKNWKELPNSVKFWNGLFLVMLILTGFYNLEYTVTIMFFGSIYTLGLFLDQADLDHQIWIYYMPITWIFIAVVVIIGISSFIYKHTIVKFNQWLDINKEKENETYN